MSVNTHDLMDEDGEQYAFMLNTVMPRWLNSIPQENSIFVHNTEYYWYKETGASDCALVASITGCMGVYS